MVLNSDRIDHKFLKFLSNGSFCQSVETSQTVFKCIKYNVKN